MPNPFASQAPLSPQVGGASQKRNPFASSAPLASGAGGAPTSVGPPRRNPDGATTRPRPPPRRLRWPRLPPTVSSRTNSRRRRPPRACTRRPPRCTPRARPRDRRDTARRGANPITTPSAIAGGARATAPASAASRPSALRPRRRTPPPPRPPRCSSRRRNPPLVSPDPRAVRPHRAHPLRPAARRRSGGAADDGPLARVRAAHRRAVARRASTAERRAPNLPSRPRALLQRRRVGWPRARVASTPSRRHAENADVSRVRQRHARIPARVREKHAALMAAAVGARRKELEGISTKLGGMLVFLNEGEGETLCRIRWRTRWRRCATPWARGTTRRSTRICSTYPRITGKRRRTGSRRSRGWSSCDGGTRGERDERASERRRRGEHDSKVICYSSPRITTVRHRSKTRNVRT